MCRIGGTEIKNTTLLKAIRDHTHTLCLYLGLTHSNGKCQNVFFFLLSDRIKPAACRNVKPIMLVVGEKKTDLQLETSDKLNLGSDGSKTGIMTASFHCTQTKHYDLTQDQG